MSHTTQIVTYGYGTTGSPFRIYALCRECEWESHQEWAVEQWDEAATVAYWHHAANRST